jgi:plasmid maintenance system antidote protein VapI
MDCSEVIAPCLKALRLASGFKQARAWCEHIDVPESVWNPFERGNRRISLDVAIKVCKKSGVSRDWIYRGLEHMLPLDLAKRLQEVED